MIQFEYHATALPVEHAIVLSDDSLPSEPAPEAAPTGDALQEARMQREAAFAQMYRIVGDLHEVLSERNRALDAHREAHLQTLFRLAMAASYRQHSIGTHIVRVGAMSALLARALGRPAAWCEMMLHAAQLHDVGHIAVPDALLARRQQLNPQDEATVRSHTVIGARLLGGSNIPVQELAAEIALSHHERWDSSGYPSGLKRKEIPLSARIVGLADHLDKVIEDHRGAHESPEEASLQALRRERGVGMDPELVDIAVAQLPRLLEVREQIDIRAQKPDARADSPGT